MKIYEMSTSRKHFLNTLNSYQRVFMEHIFLLGAYSNSTSVNHWISELVTYCMLFDGVKLKSNKKLLPNDFLEYLLIEVEEISDAKFLAGLHDGKLIQFSNDESCGKFVKTWKTLRLDLAKSFASKENNTRAHYTELLRKLL